ncbi:MAG: radical SAM protein [Candidatus Omnitrophica bacterium]|nr:radical SAM protein [Candidatus Omnitrophota bacterium]
MKPIRWLNDVKKVQDGLETPYYLTHFISNRCNLSCEHCFYWVDLNTKVNELSLQEIEKVLKSLKNPLRGVILTGGESFLRKDIDEIVKLYIDITSTPNIIIASNGFYLDVMKDKLEKTLPYANSHGTQIDVQISLDGLEATHNAIRRNSKSFQKACETIHALKDWKNRFPLFEISVLTVLNKKNFRDMEAIAKFVNEDLNVRQGFEIIRGRQYLEAQAMNNSVINQKSSPKEDDIFLTVEDLEWLKPRLEAHYRFERKYYRAFSPSYRLPYTGFETVLESLKQNKSIVPCLAGNLFGVLYPEGEVSVCELLTSMGNVRNHNLDFAKLWHSEAAQTIKQQVKGCFCPQGCYLQQSTKYDVPTFLGQSLQYALGK